MMNPTGLLKVIAALTPIMGNQELGESMAREIQAMFEAMQRSADAMQRIDARLARIEEKLQMLPVRLADGELNMLLLSDYSERVEQAIIFGEHHNDG